MLKYCIERYKTQEICNKVLDDCLPASKFNPGWSVTNKMFKKLEYVVFSNDDIDLDDKESDIITFFRDDMGQNIRDINNMNLDDDDFSEDDSGTIIHVRRMAWCNRYKQRKTCKKEISIKFIPVAWHPTRWRDWCMLEDK